MEQTRTLVKYDDDELYQDKEKDSKYVTQKVNETNSSTKTNQEQYEQGIWC